MFLLPFKTYLVVFILLSRLYRDKKKKKKKADSKWSRLGLAKLSKTLDNLLYAVYHADVICSMYTYQINAIYYCLGNTRLDIITKITH